MRLITTHPKIFLLAAAVLLTGLGCGEENYPSADVERTASTPIAKASPEEVKLEIMVKDQRQPGVDAAENAPGSAIPSMASSQGGAPSGMPMSYGQGSYGAQNSYAPQSGYGRPNGYSAQPGTGAGYYGQGQPGANLPAGLGMGGGVSNPGGGFGGPVGDGVGGPGGPGIGGGPGVGGLGVGGPGIGGPGFGGPGIGGPGIGGPGFGGPGFGGPGIGGPGFGGPGIGGPGFGGPGFGGPGIGGPGFGFDGGFGPGFDGGFGPGFGGPGPWGPFIAPGFIAPFFPFLVQDIFRFDDDHRGKHKRRGRHNDDDDAVPVARRNKKLSRR